MFLENDCIGVTNRGLLSLNVTHILASVRTALISGNTGYVQTTKLAAEKCEFDPGTGHETVGLKLLHAGYHLIPKV